MIDRLKSIGAFLLLALSLVTVTLTPGCGSVEPGGAYEGDSFLYNTENNLVTAKASLDQVVKWEYQNRKLLSETPEITRGVDAIRAKAPISFASANRLVTAYKASPTPANKEALEAAVRVFNQLVQEALFYYTQYGLKH